MKGLRDLEALLGRYVVMSDEQRLVVALWVLHAHTYVHFDQTPYLLVTSPERRCGKTTLLELVEMLVPRPFSAVLPSEAVVYRTIESSFPTLLLDEVDAVFNPRTADRHEGLRALLNAGNRNGATVPRCVGNSQTPTTFRVYCPKLIAGIGTMPDTITDRSVPIRLQRKTRAEHVHRFRKREALALAEPLRERIAVWAKSYGEQLAAARPDLPDELNDRAQDFSEPLVAIADLLGVGERARAALVSIMTAEREDSTERAQERLLGSMRELFRELDQPGVHTESVLFHLNADGWGDWYGGRGLTAGDLAALLKPYGIHPKNVRVADDVRKGYHRDQFAEAFARYLPEEKDGEAEGGS